MAISMDLLNGCSSTFWFYGHVIGHHVYTNIDGADPDIAVNEVDVRRIRPWQKHMTWYTRQYLYIPFLYCVLMMKTRVMDFGHVYVNQRNLNIRINPLAISQHAVFWGGKVSQFGIYTDNLPLTPAIGFLPDLSSRSPIYILTVTV